MVQFVLNNMPGAFTGTVVLTDHLNSWGGKKPRQEANAEPVFEQVTGK